MEKISKHKISLWKSIRFKYIFSIITMVAMFVAVVFTYILIDKQRYLRESLLQKAKLFATYTSRPLYNYYGGYYMYHVEADYQRFKKFVEETLSKNKDVIHFKLINRKEEILFDTLEFIDGWYEGEEKRKVTDNHLIQEIKKVEERAEQGIFDPFLGRTTEIRGRKVIELLAPVTSSNLIFAIGVYYISEDAISDAITATTKGIITIALWFLLVGIMLAVLLANFIVKPISLLSNAMKEVKEGHLGKQVNLSYKDEIGEMAQTFNQMSSENYKMYQKVNELNKTLEKRVSDRTLELKKAVDILKESETRFNDVSQCTGDWIWEVDMDCRFTYSSSVVEQVLGYKTHEVEGKYIYDFFCAENKEELKKKLFSIVGEKKEFRNFENINIRKDNKTVILETSGVAIMTNDGVFNGYRGVNRDVTERKISEQEIIKANLELASNEKELRDMLAETQRMHNELKNTQMKLFQSDKMAAIGQLAAGIAHEINNPIGFVSSNIDTLKDYLEQYAKIINIFKGYNVNSEFDIPEMLSRLKREYEKADMDFIATDIDNLLNETKDGLSRVKKIVSDLRTFSHKSTEVKEGVDIIEVIEGVLTIVWNEIKYTSKLEKDYSDVSKIKCNPQMMGQVFLNIIINASQSIETEGTIKVKVFEEEKFVCVEIRDTGIGIPEKNIEHIFDPFFTTKPVGKGTGLGLSIAYDIVKQHNGDILVKSEKGVGTSFIIKLPKI